MLSGLHFTDATSTGLITSLLPAIVICINLIFFKQKLTKKIIISLAIAILGLILINYNTIESNANNNLIGNLLVLAALLPDTML